MFIFENILINTNHDFHFLDNSKATFVYFEGHYNWCPISSKQLPNEVLISTNQQQHYSIPKFLSTISQRSFSSRIISILNLNKEKLSPLNLSTTRAVSLSYKAMAKVFNSTTLKTSSKTPQMWGYHQNLTNNLVSCNSAPSRQTLCKHLRKLLKQGLKWANPNQLNYKLTNNHLVLQTSTLLVQLQP